MTELCKNIENGQVQITDEVIAVIAATATQEDAACALYYTFTEGFIEKLGKKNLSKGVKVTVTDANVSLEITVSVKFGQKIKEVCEDIQLRVKNAIETMTGLTVTTVNIIVIGVFIDKSVNQ